MTTDQIIDLVIEIAPSIVTIITVIGVIARVIMSFKGLKKDVTTDTTDHKEKVNQLYAKTHREIEELNSTMRQLVQENYELKKQLNETLTKMDHIDRRKK